MANKHKKWCSASVEIKKMQIKTKAIRSAKILMYYRFNCSREFEKERDLIIWGININWH